MPSDPLLIQALLPELRVALNDHRRVLLSAPPGSGKTTGIPPALLNEPWLAGQSLVMLQPRRLATRMVTARIAEQLGEAVGATAGYQVRLDRRIGPGTRIQVVTEGILTQRLQADPELTNLGLVIFDEFHERSLHADLALALVLEVQQSLREDLRLLVMSATLPGEPLRRLLGEDTPLLTAEGRSHPITLHYTARDDDEIVPGTLRGLQRALAETRGDILCFLPGTGEIRKLAEALRENYPQLAVRPLYGELDPAEQDLALRPDDEGRRRVVLATAVAETSLTIDGIHTVVDSGWSRRPDFDPNTGLDRLRTLRLSRAAADQRAGRAGRLGPGTCYRLWSEARQQRLEPFDSAEILRADLAPLVLELARWGIADPSDLNWPDAPPTGHYNQARELLRRLGALDHQHRITADGRRMAGLGCHPRLAHLLLRGAELGQLARAADLAALLGERSPLRRRPGQPGEVDLDQQLAAVQAYRDGDSVVLRRLDADPASCKRIARQADRWRAQLTAAGQPASVSSGLLLAFAFPDRIAQRRGQQNGRFQLANGRAARLDANHPLSASDLLVAADLDAGSREGRIYRAAAIDLAEIHQHLPELIMTSQRCDWDEREQAVIARTEQRLGALVLDTRPLTDASPESLRQSMLDGIRRLGLAALPWSDEAQGLRARVTCLTEWQPKADWPDWSDEALLDTLESWLGPWLDGITRRSQLHRLDLPAILRATLSWDQQQALDRLAPQRLQVPSGSRHPIQYHPGATPVLAVRLQEMFGLDRTPCICDGQVPLTLHLLSPARRPIQVTQDLQGFWDRTYAEVRKELKGRYPKHYWPEDPRQAIATARVRPRA